MNQGNIPVIAVRARTAAYVYEEAFVRLMREGTELRTQYDAPGDRPSLDATVNLTIDEPFTDPMLHKCFPGGAEDLREYLYELEGRKDSWIRPDNDITDKRWAYLYHGRLCNYGLKKRLDFLSGDVHWCGDSIDQIRNMVDTLVTEPLSRRAQAITWYPTTDIGLEDPPCLQSIQCRLVKVDSGYCLNTNIRFRSNDAFGAWVMNCFGLSWFVKLYILEPIAARLGASVAMGRLNWQADSWHIYGKDRARAEKFLKRIESGEPVIDRVISFWDPEFNGDFYQCEAALEQKFQDVEKGFKETGKQ